MSVPNTERLLSFTNPWISCLLLESAKNKGIDEAIVVNLSSESAIYRAGSFRGSIPAFQSRKLIHCEIESGERLAVFTQQKHENLGGLALTWSWLGETYKSFDRNTPLYVSRQDSVAEVELNPGTIFNFAGQERCGPKRYDLRLNLWYAPALTDCSIHYEHSFLEVHTQLVGTGHMQKFQSSSAETLFEDVICPPGATHDAFFQLSDEKGFHYPQHRYFAQTDCVWMAIEFHPVDARQEGGIQ